MKKIISLICTYLFITSIYVQSITLPYYTGFDSPAERAGWQQFRTGVVSNFEWENAGGELSHDYNVGANSSDTLIDWFVSPPLNFTNIGQIAFKVRSWGFSPIPFSDGCEVYVTTSNPNPLSNNYTLIGNLSFQPDDNMWRDTIFDVSLQDDSVYIAFKYKTIGAHWRIYSIDSITIRSDPSTSISSANEEIIELLTFPNPVTNALQIKWNQKINNALIVITDLQGTIVKKVSNFTSTSQNINVKNLNSGLYNIYLVQDQTVLSESRIVIQH